MVHVVQLPVVQLPVVRYYRYLLHVVHVASSIGITGTGICLERFQQWRRQISSGAPLRVAQFFAGLFTTVGLMRTDAERDADNRDKMWERDNQKRQEFKAAASPAAPVLGTYRLCQVPPQPRRPQQHLIACDLAIRCPPAAANAGACATRFTQRVMVV